MASWVDDLFDRVEGVGGAPSVGAADSSEFDAIWDRVTPEAESESLFSKYVTPASLLRIGAPLVGGIAGGLIAGPPGAAGGIKAGLLAAGGAAVGGALGEAGAETLEGQPLDAGEIALAGGLSALPAGPAARAIRPGMSLAARGGLHTLEGIGQGVADVVGTSLYREGELPSMEDLTAGGTVGGVLGAGLGLGLERAFRPGVQPPAEPPQIQPPVQNPVVDAPLDLRFAPQARPEAPVGQTDGESSPLITRQPGAPQAVQTSPELKAILSGLPAEQAAALKAQMAAQNSPAPTATVTNTATVEGQGGNVDSPEVNAETLTPRYAYRARDKGEAGVPSKSHSQASLSEADVRRIAPSRSEGEQEVVRIDLSKFVEGQDYRLHERPDGAPWVQFLRPLEETNVERVGEISQADRLAADKASPELRAAVASQDPVQLAQKAGLTPEQAVLGVKQVEVDGLEELKPEAVAVKRAVLAEPEEVDVDLGMLGAQAEDAPLGAPKYATRVTGEPVDVPREAVMRNPISGRDGSQIVGYEWRSMVGEKFSEREGGMVSARVSDWGRKDSSTGTGRNIVHVFYVKHPDGTITTEGVRSAQNILGLNEARLRSIASSEQSTQMARVRERKALASEIDQRGRPTPAEATRMYRLANPNATDAEVGRGVLMEKEGKFARLIPERAELAAEFGWTRSQNDPLNPESAAQPSGEQPVGAVKYAAKADQDYGKPHPETGHKFSSTQVDLPEEVGAQMRSLAAKIPERDLSTDPNGAGRESEPHVTVKFGLHTDNVDDVQRALADEGPIRVRLGKTSLFPSKEGAAYDVLKLDVDSPDLHRLNAKIAAAVKTTDTHPDYKPHATLAYLKPGAGKKYAGDGALAGTEITLDRLTFSTRSGQKVEVPLVGAPKFSARPVDSSRVTPKGGPGDRAAEPQGTPGGGEKFAAKAIDPDSLPREVLSQMSQRLKAMGYDSRGADDVRASMKKRGGFPNDDWRAAYEAAVGTRTQRQTRAKSLKKQTPHVNWGTVNRFGTTSDPKRAGYVRPDGKLLDLSGGGAGSQRGDDHRIVGGTAGMQELKGAGYIRWMPEADGLDIAKEPTAQQFGAIRRLAERARGKMTLDLSDGIGEFDSGNGYYRFADRKTSLEFPEGTNPEKIVGTIRRFFAGEDFESGTRYKAAPAEEPGAQNVGTSAKDADNSVQPEPSSTPRGQSEVVDSLSPEEFLARAKANWKQVPGISRHGSELRFRAPNGKPVVLRPSGEIVFTREGVEQGHGAKMATDVEAGRAQVVGRTYETNARIIAEAIDTGTMDHEMGHVLKDHFATARERRAIDADPELKARAEKSGRAVDEEWADWLAEYFAARRQGSSLDSGKVKDSVLTRVAKRIYDFLLRVKDTFAPSKEGVARSAESGRIFGRKEGDFSGRAEAAYKVAADAVGDRVENFKRWFGEGQRGANANNAGEPMPLYHGTGASFTEFREGSGGAAGPGIYLSKQPQLSNAFAGNREGAGVMKVYARGRFLKMPFNEAINAKEWGERARREGYDGLDTGLGELVVFDSRNIKSATGNRGSFDPQNPDIRYATKPIKPIPPKFATAPAGPQPQAPAQQAQPGPKFNIPDEGLADKFIRNIQDKFIRPKRFIEAIGKQGGNVSPDKDFYRAEELFHGRTEERLRDAEQKFAEPLIKGLSKEKVQLADLDKYLYAKHAPERNKIISGRTNGQVTDGSGMSDQEAAQILADFQTKGLTPKLDRLAKFVRDARDEQIDVLLKGGLISQAQANGWKTAFGPDYVPLRTMEVEEGLGTGQGFDIRGKEAKSATGRGSKADSPTTFMLAQLQRAIVRAEKNKVAQTFAEFAKANPDPDLWEFNKKHTRKELNAQGQVTDVQDMRAYQEDFDYKENGETKRVTIKDPLLLSAMKNMGAEKTGEFLSKVGNLTRRYTALLTSYSPEFILTNPIRDIQAAVVNVSTEQGTKIAKDMAKSIPQAVRGMMQSLRNPSANNKWARLAKEFREDGGSVGFYSVKPADELAKEIEGKIRTAGPGAVQAGRRALGSMVQWIEDANKAMENGTRLSVYSALRDAGATREAAASVAKNVTLNFNRKGEAGPAINSLYAFFNASIQGSARLVQVAAKNPKGRMVAGGLVGLGMAMDAYNRGISGDKNQDGQNDYDSIPEYVKDRNLVVMRDGKKPLLFPMPYGFNALITAGRQLSAVTQKAVTPQRAAVSVASSVYNAFNPLGGEDDVVQAFSPTFLDPVVQHATNRNFAGKQIRPERFPGSAQKPDSETFFKNVSPVAREIARVMNTATGGDKVTPGYIDVSPETIQHFYEFASGGLGRFAGNVASVGAGLAEGETPEIRNVPFVRRFQYAEHGGEQGQKYRENVDELETLWARYKEYKAERNTSRLKDLPMDLLRAKGQVDSIDNQIRRLRKALGVRPDLQKQIDQLQLRANRLVAQARQRAGLPLGG